jgi:hypothetical protein
MLVAVCIFQPCFDMLNLCLLPRSLVLLTRLIISGLSSSTCRDNMCEHFIVLIAARWSTDCVKCWRKLYIEELHQLYSSHSIMGMFKFKKKSELTLDSVGLYCTIQRHTTTLRQHKKHKSHHTPHTTRQRTPTSVEDTTSHIMDMVHLHLGAQTHLDLGHTC